MLAQQDVEEAQEVQEAGEDELTENVGIEDCLTEEEASFDLFAKTIVAGEEVPSPGGVRGLGNSVAAKAGGVRFIAELPEEEFEEVKAGIREITNRFKEGELDAREVIEELIKEFGCQPVKEVLQIRLEKAEKGEDPFQKRKKQAEAAAEFMPEKPEQVGKLVEEKLDEKFDELLKKLKD